MCKFSTNCYTKYSLTCPNSIVLLMDSQPKKTNCFINGLSGMTRASFLQIARPNTDLKPVWFTPISILSSHISFLISQTEFLCLSHIGVSICVSVSGSCRVKVGVFD